MDCQRSQIVLFLPRSFTIIMSRYLQWSSLAILATGLLSVGPVGIYAQSTDVVCLASFNWVRRYALTGVLHS